MNHFDRIFSLHQLLTQSRTPISLLKIGEALECSPATAKRTIGLLRDSLNAPIAYDRPRNGYHFVSTGANEIRFELPGLWLNASELYALLVSNELLSKVQPGLLEQQIGPLRSRIEHLLDNACIDATEAACRIRILQIASRPVRLDAFRQIASAVLEQKRLHILYHDRARDQTTERDISPQRLVYYRDNWYLDAWCHLRSALRTFSIDRIHPVYCHEQAAKSISDDQLNGMLTKSYGIFSGRPNHTAVLRFSPEAAKWVADEQWHPQQHIKILKDGGLELKIPYSNSTELIMDILKYGPDVEVIGPQTLRDAVAKRLRNAFEQYR